MSYLKSLMALKFYNIVVTPGVRANRQIHITMLVIEIPISRHLHFQWLNTGALLKGSKEILTLVFWAL